MGMVLRTKREMLNGDVDEADRKAGEQAGTQKLETGTRNWKTETKHD
jgi:hypothetical protein